MALVGLPSSPSPAPVSALSVALPAAILALLLGVTVVKAGFFDPAPSSPAIAAPAMVTLPPGTFLHRLDGEYYRGGFAVDAPRREIAITAPLEIMTSQVSARAYDACVAAGRCSPREPGHAPDAAKGEEVPATGVSYDDAMAFAAWLSAGTSDRYDLPTDAEWAYAAGDAFVDDALGIDPDSTNPALRWLADYNRETARKASTDPAPKPLGRFGVNEKGLSDLAGNVWEWTGTCQRRIDLAATGAAARVDSSCGIYVVEGRHRAAMSSFVRDPRSGGCSVGAPPDNLGFRLVRRPDWIERLRQNLGF